MKRPKLKDPVSASSILNRIVNQFGLRAGLSRHMVINRWSEIVGPRVAHHARATEVQGSVIHVAVDSSVWMNELAAIKITLLEKVNASLEEGAAPITDIRFRQVSSVHPPQSHSVEPDPPTPDEELSGIVRATLEPVGDNELRSLLERILKKDLQLKKRRNRPEPGSK